MFIKVSMACCSHLFIFHFKEKFTGQQVTFQRFIKRSKDLIKKLNLWFYLTQIVLSNGKILFPWRKKILFIKVSMVHCSHFVIFNFLQGKVGCFGTRFQVICSDCVYLCQKNVTLHLSVVFAPWRWDCWSVYLQFYLTK